MCQPTRFSDCVRFIFHLHPTCVFQDSDGEEGATQVYALIIPIDLPLITVLAAISFMYMITGCMKLRTILFWCAGSLAHDSLEDRV